MPSASTRARRTPPAASNDAGSLTLDIEGRSVKCTRLGNVLYPAAKFTKADPGLGALMDRYPRVVGLRRGLDFERLAMNYDGLHLTHDGYMRTRSRRPGPALIGWECESTLWFRWVSTEWHDVQPSFKDVDRFDEMWLTLSGWSTEDYTCHRMPEDKASKRVYEAMLRDMAAAT